MASIFHSFSSPLRSAYLRAVLGAMMLALFAASAHAQLARLIAPVEVVPKVEKQELAGDAAAAGTETEKARDPLEFTGEDLLREIKAQLIDHYALGGDLTLELARPWGAMKVPASGVDIKVSDFPRDGLATVFNVRVKMTSGGQPIGEWQVSLRARLWQEVWVASARLDRGQALDEQTVNAQTVDVLQNHNALLGTDEKPSAYELAQNVNAGSPLMKRDVVEKPVIRKNQIVEVVANRGALTITMKAQALESGAVKALIRMRNLDSKREFNAQVIDETRANVVF